MKGALFAALHKSPWLVAVLALVTLVGLRLVLAHSYKFSLHSPSIQLDLAPAR